MEKIILSKYRKWGTLLGDYWSYDYMFDTSLSSSFLDRYEKKLRLWESRYTALGYIPLSNEEWIEVGGYDVPIECTCFGKKTL